mmetsp:Transcript_33015/g.72557  ORF Transcript_33015/g.72557 Transcript_33015/m.72557 type:complete len:453 (-) Transcript_33015:320-1678(-)
MRAAFVLVVWLPAGICLTSNECVPTLDQISRCRRTTCDAVCDCSTFDAWTACAALGGVRANDASKSVCTMFAEHCDSGLTVMCDSNPSVQQLECRLRRPGDIRPPPPPRPPPSPSLPPSPLIPPLPPSPPRPPFMPIASNSAGCLSTILDLPSECVRPNECGLADCDVFQTVGFHIPCRLCISTNPTRDWWKLVTACMVLFLMLIFICCILRGLFMCFWRGCCEEDTGLRRFEDEVEVEDLKQPAHVMGAEAANRQGQQSAKPAAKKLHSVSVHSTTAIVPATSAKEEGDESPFSSSPPPARKPEPRHVANGTAPERKVHSRADLHAPSATCSAARSRPIESTTAPYHERTSAPHHDKASHRRPAAARPGSVKHRHAPDWEDDHSSDVSVTPSEVKAVPPSRDVRTAQKHPEWVNMAQSLNERLKALETLKIARAITEEEYLEKRAKLINTL